jgi:hypothetical protein
MINQDKWSFNSVGSIRFNDTKQERMKHEGLKVTWKNSSNKEE